MKVGDRVKPCPSGGSSAGLAARSSRSAARSRGQVRAGLCLEPASLPLQPMWDDEAQFPWPVRAQSLHPFMAWPVALLEEKGVGEGVTCACYENLQSEMMR